MVVGQSIVAEVPDTGRHQVWPKTKGQRPTANDDFLTTDDCYAIQPFLLYVLFHRRIHVLAQRLLRRNRFADRRGRHCLVHVLQQMDGRSPQHQIALGRLFSEGLAHVPWRPDLLRQGIGHIGQGVSGAAGHDKFTFAKQGLGLVPVRDLGEGVHANQKKYAVDFLQRLFQTPDRVNAVVRPGHDVLGGPPLASGGRNLDHSGSLQNRRDKRLLAHGGQHHHGVAVEIWSHRPALLVGRNIGRHKVDAPQIEAFLRRPGQRQVPVVNRIERPAQQTDIHGIRRVRPSA